MTLESEREKWLEDLEQRQRNIVFPDTANNEGRFWKGLRDSKRYTVIQWIGIVVMGLVLLGTVVSGFQDPLDGFSWARTTRMIITIVVGMLFFGAFLLAMSWSIRLDAHLHDRRKNEEIRKK